MITEQTEATFSPYPGLLISREALEHNLNLIRSLVKPGVKVMIPVKANGYGCGIRQILPVLQEERVDILGVANPLEGVELRSLGWEGPIINLGGFYNEHISLFSQYSITPSITDVWHIEALQKEALRLSEPLGVHLKLDLGMGRIGIKEEDLPRVVTLLKESESIALEGIFIHFPNADNKGNGDTV